MKYALLALLLTATPAFAKPGKLVITYTPRGQETQDCKISEKEITKIFEKSKDKGLCTKISAVSPAKEELVPEKIAKLIALDKAKKGRLMFAYTGAESAPLIQTVAAWMDFLARRNRAGLWAVTLLSSANNVAVVQIANAAGEAINLPVILSYEIPDTDEE